MRSKSRKMAKRDQEASPFRKALVIRVGKCEVCGRSPRNKETRAGRPVHLCRLCVHEIASGPNRSKALDKPYATLVACWGCNGDDLEDRSKYPESRQLGLLLASRPMDFDLAAYHELTSPNAPRRITLQEVLNTMPDEFLTKSEIANKLGVDRRLVQSWIESGELKAGDAASSDASVPLYKIHWADFVDFCKTRGLRPGKRPK